MEDEFVHTKDRALKELIQERDELRAELKKYSGDNDRGYQDYKIYNPDPKKSYLEWLKTGMEYLEEAAHAAALGKSPLQYLATRAPTMLRDRIAELEAQNRSALDHAVSAIYFCDSSDYKGCLWSVVRAIGGDEAVDLLVKDERAAFEKYTNVGREYAEEVLKGGEK